MKKIFLVEDDIGIVEALVFALEKKFEVEVATTKKEALEKIRKSSIDFDLALLDISLPDGNSLEFCKEINRPIIFLTAKDDEETIIKGLSLGEEYVTKPFKSKVLIARIEKVLQRYQSEEIVYKELRINKEANKVYVERGEVTLTALDFEILLLLFENIGRTITRERLIDLILDSTGNVVEDNTLSVYVKRVRDKIGLDYIKTIKRVGYIVEK